MKTERVDTASLENRATLASSHHRGMRSFKESTEKEHQARVKNQMIKGSFSSIESSVSLFVNPTVARMFHLFFFSL